MLWGTGQISSVRACRDSSQHGLSLVFLPHWSLLTDGAFSTPVTLMTEYMLASSMDGRPQRKPRWGCFRSLVCIGWKGTKESGLSENMADTGWKSSFGSDTVGHLPQGPESRTKPQPKLQAEDRVPLPKPPYQKPNSLLGMGCRPRDLVGL